MPDTNEPLSAVLAEMRAAAKSTDLFDGEEVGEPLIRGMKVEEWADRIERAANNLESSFGMALAIEDGLRKRDAGRAAADLANLRAAVEKIRDSFKQNEIAYWDRWMKWSDWHWDKKAKKAKEMSDMFAKYRQRIDAALKGEGEAK